MPVVQEQLTQGLRCQRAGRLDCAADIYRDILRRDPGHGDALHLLGVVAHQQGDSRNAVEYLRQAIAENPDQPDYHCNLGVANHELGHYEEAVLNYREALKIDPRRAEAHNNLGNSLASLGRNMEAAESFRGAISLAPRYAKAYINFGRVLISLGDDEEAIASLRRGMEITPQAHRAYSLLADALHRRGRHAEAIEAYERFLELCPLSAEATHNKGTIELESYRLEASGQTFQRAICLQPNLVEAHNNLGISLLAQGRVGEAIDGFRSAVRIQPRYAAAHSNLLMAMHYDPTCDDATMLREHLRWASLNERPADWRHGNNRDPHRCLRIGYVSPDLRTHAVSYFLEPILRNHDRDSCETFCYADVRKPDATTDRLRSLAHQWRDIHRMSDDQFAERVRRDEIDILVDLAGHTAGNRLVAFGKKPAPIQVTYLGYGSTTGLSGMDYRITDEITDPAGEPQRHCEILVRHPHGFACYSPPGDAPDLAAPPVTENGYVTFGSFNNIAKINAEVLRVWVTLLQSVPGSRLLLKTRSFNDPQVAARWRSHFAAAGLTSERVEILGKSPTVRGHFELYNRVDIALDPFPYTGSTTTCEALSMGVPVVTLRGGTYVGRMTSSILQRVGAEELIAESPASYMALAGRLAGNVSHLIEIRNRLRQQLAESPFCAAKDYTRALEQIYRAMWHRWCGEHATLCESPHALAIGDPLLY